MLHKAEHDAIWLPRTELPPYGTLSAFAATPIWIAGRRYPTVEHWYQAMRAVDDEHEWIRAAPDAAEAKRRAGTIAPRAYWLAEKVLVMYRGMLAKCRQHPAIAALLVSTGDANIHEDDSDPFWGFAGGQGADWLGKVLGQVRATLRTTGVDGPLSGLLRGRFLNYETAAAVRRIRNDGDPWFVHLIRHRESQDPVDTLLRIIDEGLLRTSRLLNGYNAVCFSAAPLRDLALKVFDTEARLRQAGAAHVYSPFGIAMPYDFGRELGLRPVLPLPTEITATLPPYLRFLSQPYAPADLLDYTHEDEWRAAFNVDIREGPFGLVVPNGTELRVAPMHDMSRVELFGRVQDAAERWNSR